MLKCWVFFPGPSSPLPQVTSPSFDDRGEPPSSVEKRRSVGRTPTSANRRRERENGSAERRSRSPSVANSGYSSPYEIGTPGTPGFNRGTYPSHFFQHALVCKEHKHQHNNNVETWTFEWRMLARLIPWFRVLLLVILWDPRTASEPSRRLSPSLSSFMEQLNCNWICCISYVHMLKSIWGKTYVRDWSGHSLDSWHQRTYSNRLLEQKLHQIHSDLVTFLWTSVLHPPTLKFKQFPEFHRPLALALANNKSHASLKPGKLSLWLFWCLGSLLMLMFSAHEPVDTLTALKATVFPQPARWLRRLNRPAPGAAAKIYVQGSKPGSKPWCKCWTSFNNSSKCN